MLYLEDLQPGSIFKSREYEFTPDNVKAFAGEYDPQWFHLDEELAKESFFEGLAASGWHVGSVTMRLLSECLPIATGVIGGGVDVRWVSATRPGDFLHIEVEILNVSPSQSKPDRGMAEIFIKTVNQDQVVRQTISCTLLVFSKKSVGKRPRSFEN